MAKGLRICTEQMVLLGDYLGPATLRDIALNFFASADRVDWSATTTSCAVGMARLSKNHMALL